MEWEGSEIDEKGVITGIRPSSLLAKYECHIKPRLFIKGEVVISVDPRYFRPTEVETLLGDPGKANRKLGWMPEIPFETMVHDMVVNDLNETVREAIWERNDLAVPDSCEADM